MAKKKNKETIVEEMQLQSYECSVFGNSSGKGVRSLNEIIKTSTLEDIHKVLEKEKESD